MTTLRDAFVQMIQGRDGLFVRRMLLHSINHRVQDFPDPLTTTLVLMATSPLQLVLCESGLLLFKSNLLPVLPYTTLKASERALLRSWIEPLPHEQLHETVEPNGQYTLTVLLTPPSPQRTAASPPLMLCKRTLLHAFVELMTSAPTDAHRTLCNIVLQRFWSRVPTPSDTVQAVMSKLQPPTPTAAAATIVAEPTMVMMMVGTGDISSGGGAKKKKKRARSPSL
jgi:hypothetical protein